MLWHAISSKAGQILRTIKIARGWSTPAPVHL
jgi:hypothetical protein